MLEFNSKIFNPQTYVSNYYPDFSFKEGNKSTLTENNYVLKFFAKNVLPTIKKNRGAKKLLEVGGGPTIYQLISLSKEVDSIFFSDICKKNLSQVKLWKTNQISSWDSYIKKSLHFEKKRKPKNFEIASRAYTIKRKIKGFYKYDVIKNFWGKAKPNIKLFDIVASNFCIESITSNLKTWSTALENIASLVLPGGYLIITSLKNSKGYKIGNNKFPAVKITENLIRGALTKLGFDSKIYSKKCINKYYSGIIFVIAQKKCNTNHVNKFLLH